MNSFESAFKTISHLVKDFKENEKHFLNPSYSEADVRNDFINKFFIALGWDVRHETQKNPYEQEVRVEKPVTVAKAQKRADYTFYLAPNFRDVKFFVEAKKPSHDLENKDYYFQTVRYGWNANTPVAVLTDFEEFVILDCRFRPDINDILNYELKSFHYSDYAEEEKLKEIYYLFSREAVEDNSISKFVETLPKPRGKKKARVKEKYQNIDEAFLEELDEIRTRLAKSFKKNNTHLSSDELTEATQRTIDRLVFIKFLEDKMIEPHHYVSEFGKRRTAWEDFITASRTLDAKYNGVVFKKTTIDSRSIVEPDDKTFSSICEELSHDNSPYNFDAIPIHILGSIYERFLGKVVNATDKRVTIEEKPEVRKAGGVYYTPQYIVNYIVDNTVVKLIEGKTPKEIAKMRLADIACGSGSFLITVYERLIDYHKQWYQQHPEQAKKDGCILFEGAYRLSLQQKQKILLNNIYGVDLDQQAVEVTQLSLYLKLLEDETTATANDTWVMFKEQLLPDLNKNIICGNSLIGNDILESNLFDYEDEKKLKPMNFENVFSEVMKAGGFDAIVGNPPYVHSRDEQLAEMERNYFYNNYRTSEYQINTYGLFIEKATTLIKRHGLLGYIIPNYWLSTKYDSKLRRLLLWENKTIDLLNVYKVFVDAVVDTVIIIVEKKFVKKYALTVKALDRNLKTIQERLDNIASENWAFIKSFEIENEKETSISFSQTISLNAEKNICDYFELRFGVKLYQVGKGKPPQKKSHSNEKVFEANKKIDDAYLKLLRARSVQRYVITDEEHWIKYGVHLAEPRSIELFTGPRILIQRIISKNKLDATFLDETKICNTDVITLKPINESFNPKLYLGILASKLAGMFIRSTNVNLDRAAFPKINTKTLSDFPVPNCEKINTELRNIIVNCVDQMLTTKKQLQQAKTDGDKNYLERKCARLDKEIDELVYQLYGLTDEEIRIVEGENT